MKTKQMTLRLLAMICFIGAAITASALPGFFASHSKLARGHWVKVSVDTTGITQISYDQLREWGFSDPAKVHVFGRGGKMIPEVLSEEVPDDVAQVPMLRLSDKIIFYAISANNGLSGATVSENPYHTSQMNPYSSYGYYMLSDDSDYSDTGVNVVTNADTGTTAITSSFDFTLHELELNNVGSTGKLFTGESFAPDLSYRLTMPLRDADATQPVTLYSSLMYNSTSQGTLSATLNGQNIEFLSSTNVFRALSDYDIYKQGFPRATFTLDAPAGTADIALQFTSSGAVRYALLDYVTLTFKHTNSVRKYPMQRIYVQGLDAATSRIDILGNNDQFRVWDISDATAPVEYTLEYTADGDGYLGSFTPGMSRSWTQFVAFDPTATQRTVKYVAEVPNQDLHGLATPDMLIISVPEFMDQAERIAEYHRTADGLDVAVVDGDQVINEFAAGTPDPSAYRRMAKMFYDRDPEKFRYLLFFGGGSFDNRNVTGVQTNLRLLTYQSNASSNETESFTTDDFYGMLDDYSGASITSDYVRIRIGRFPVVTYAEAKSAVDKLLAYVAQAEDKPWRNNALIIADEGESDLFSIQAELIGQMMTDQLNLNLHLNKIYIEDFNSNASGVAADAKARAKQLFKDGQFFTTYIGHGGPTYITKTAKFWGHEDVKNTPMPYVPIFSLATCDVAAYDSNQRGIAEAMFHQPDGGAIALLASTRTVYATENDMLNRAFITALLTPLDDGSFPTVGDAVMSAKCSFVKPSLNKLNFLLFGDPAMRAIFPRKQITVSAIGDEAPESAAIYPLSATTVEGTVNKADGTVDTDFNGKVWVTIYDASHTFKTLSLDSSTDPVAAQVQNDVLGTFSATATAGRFAVDCIVPDYNVAGSDVTTSIAVYASEPATGKYFSNQVSGVQMLAYDEEKAVADTEAPYIEQMYINDKGFHEGDFITGDVVVEAVFEDNVSLNMRSSDLGNTPTLLLDGKTAITITDAISVDDTQRSGRLSAVVKGIATGRHTLTFAVSDVAGNRTSRTVSFFYNANTVNFTLTVDEDPAIDRATIGVVTGDGSEVEEAYLTVTDNSGKLLWSAAPASLPATWDLRDRDGQRVAPGAYFLNGKFRTATDAGAAPTRKIVVVK